MDDIQAGPSTTGAALTPVPLAASKQGRSAGTKAHKAPKVAKRQSYLSESIKTPFEKRKELEKRKESTKAVEQELKEEKQGERER